MHVGLVGCGRWGKNILRDLLGLGCEVSVASHSEESRAYARSQGVATTVRSAEQLDDVAGVVVATPTVTHAAVVDAVADRGVPVFVEKPLAPDPGDARRLADQLGGRCFVMEKWRYHPGVERLGELVRSGALGAPTAVLTARLGWGIPHDDVDAVWILAPHELTIVYEILGERLEPRSAWGVARGEDWLAMTGRLGDRPWAQFEVSELSPSTVRRIDVIGSDAVATLEDPYADHLVIRARDASADTEPRREAISTEFPLLRELRAFVEHLRGGPPPRSSADEGATTVEHIQRLRELAAEAR